MRAAFEVGKGLGAAARARRVVRSYGLLLLVALAFLVMTLLVPTIDRTVPDDPTPSPAAGRSMTEGPSSS